MHNPSWRFLSPAAHGILDYVVVAAFALAPSLFDFPEGPAAISYVIAGAHLTSTLLTAFPLGVVKLIPFPVHGLLETLAAVAVLAMPWLAGFAGHPAARNFYVGAGIVVLLVVAVTNYQSSAARTHAAPATP